MLTHKILIWIWGLMVLFLLSLTQSVAEIIPPEVSRYYFVAVYGLTLLFLIRLLSGGFKVKDQESGMFGIGRSVSHSAVMLKILPWTLVLIVSLTLLTLNDNFEYLSPENSTGLATVFMCANTLFVIMLSKGAFTVTE